MDYYVNGETSTLFTGWPKFLDQLENVLSVSHAKTPKYLSALTKVIKHLKAQKKLADVCGALSYMYWDKFIANILDQHACKNRLTRRQLYFATLSYTHTMAKIGASLKPNVDLLVLSPHHLRKQLGCSTNPRRAIHRAIKNPETVWPDWTDDEFLALLTGISRSNPLGKCQEHEAFDPSI
jgi:hypothetical protein